MTVHSEAPVIVSRADATIGASDVDALVALHRQELSGGFLSSLGPAALRLMFRFAADSNSAILIVARRTADSPPLGFVLGAYSTASFYREFLTSRGLAALLILGPKLLSLRRIYRLLETLLYPRRHGSADLPAAELFDLVVDRHTQRTGVGRLLFEAFRQAVETAGHAGFRVTTGESLTTAHRFYESVGAVRVADIEVHRGASTRVYVHHTQRPEARGSLAADI